MSVPFTVIGGYLGAGKTTLLNRLLHAAGKRRIGLLINDFGAINIDAQLIESRTDEQLNLTNGCVCCGLSDGFDTALERLLDRRPPLDQIVLEASGVADVSVLAQYGQGPGLHLDGVLVLADAETVRSKAKDKYVGRTVNRQLQAADLLVLNKCDLPAPAAVDACADWLSARCPGTPLVRTRQADVPDALLFDAAARAPRREPTTTPLDARDALDAHHEHYRTWSWRGASVSESGLNRFTKAMPATLLRGKGLFQNGSRGWRWQRVGKRETLEPCEPVSGSQLVLIALASDIDTDALDALAQRHLETAR